MKKYVKWAGTALALAVLAGSITNASWLAPDPVGSPKLVAHRGLYQMYHRAGLERDTCTADRIDQPYHDYLENTVASVLRADKLGAQLVEIDIAPTADGELVVFHDWTLDCRTEGSGPVRDATLAQLKALDIGYGYTADGGKTYPFRGRFEGQMPTFEEVARALPPRASLMVNFKSKDPAEADLLAAKYAEIGRDPEQAGDAFYGDIGPISRIRDHFPGVWAWNQQEAKACSQQYLALGWSSYLPDACRGKTILVPLNYQWAYWGWPNRLIARMEEHGGRVIVVGPVGDDRPRGLTLPEQFTSIPDSYNGYIWVEDTFNLAPALYQRFDNRTSEEIAAGQRALERRRQTD